MRWPRVAAGAAAALVLAAGVPAWAAPGPPDAPQYYFDDWKVTQLWDDGARGNGVTIATIDTGVNADVPELSGRVLSGTDLGAGGNGQTDRDVEKFGHGTAMASIMVAKPGLLDITGLAPGAKVLPIAVPLNGTTDAGKPDRIADAIRYGADHGAKVISMSLGGKRNAAFDTTSCPNDEQAAVFHALSKGAIVFASVGNDGPTKNSIEDPGVCLGVVSVGAVDDEGKVAKFSTRQSYLTMTAPGVGIATLSRVPGTAYAGAGTSQSAAVASAVAAMVWSRYPKLTGRDVVTRMLATLDKSGVRGHSNAYGYGRLDARRAVTANVPTSAANPVFQTATPFLSRAAAFDTHAAAAPKPVALDTGGLGSADVGSVSRWTAQVWLGAAIALAGLVVLALLLLSRRQRRRHAFAGPPLPPPTPQPDVAPEASLSRSDDAPSGSPH